MTNRLALVVAIILGVLSILGVRYYVDKVKNQYETNAQLVELPVAGRDLRLNEIVTEKDINTHKFPRAILEGLGKYYDEGDRKVIEGSKVVVSEIRQGQVFQYSHFRRQILRQPLRIGEGFRAVTVPMNPLNGIAGMLKPTDVIDIVITSEFRLTGGVFGAAGRSQKITRTMFKKVQILALDDKTDPELQFSDYATATLQLSPYDANRLLSIMDSGGSLHFIKVDAKEDSPAGSTPVWDTRLYREIEPEIRQIETDWRK